MPNGHPLNMPPPAAGNSGAAGSAGLTRGASHHDSPHLRGNSMHDTPPPGHLKQNAAQLFNHDWQSSQANNLKNNLLTMLLGSQPQTNYSSNAQNGNFSQPAQHANPQTLVSNAANYAGQNLQNLISLAREHPDFQHLQNHAESFWRNVGQMSEVRILQTTTGEIQLTSRYAELLDRFTSHGGRLETFLPSLPANEREIFAARFQMEQTLGAGKFFIGNGIMPDKNGDFALRQFFTNTGKPADLPLNFAVAMRESGLLGAGNALFSSGQILFNAESAALLGVSLAFYQNLGATVNLKDAVIYNLLQNFLISAKENVVQRQPVNVFTNEAPARKFEQSVIVGALVNGSLQSVDKKSRFFDEINLEAWQKGEAANRLGFSAGATGAMLGAAIGCLVPLSGEVAGRATGLATSIVIGTAERGLRSINLNMLISDVVTNAVQTLLDALQDNFLTGAAKGQLPAASPFEDLNANFLNRRRNAFLTA
ncbi:MAG: hypothetical protein ABWZ66_11455 [Pyrinomonadaceae bacterium]